MTEEQLYELVNFENANDILIGIPNGIFEQLQSLVSNGKLKKQHIGFAYSYIYLQTYLYRYAKYEHFIPTPSDIKVLFGYRNDNKTLDYIIKKNGVLEEDVSLLITTNDFPIGARFEESEFSFQKELTFTRLSDIKHDDYWEHWINQWKNLRGVTTRSTCKLPVFGFHYDYKYGLNDEDDYDGSFYITHNQTLLDFRVFAYCMANPEELGSNAFYLYAYLLNENFKTKGDFKATRNRMIRETLLSDKTIRKYMGNMRAYKMIETLHNMEYFSLGWEKDERQASNHKVNTYDHFTYTKTEYTKLEAVDRFTHSQILKQKRYQEENMYKADIKVEELPF